MKSMTHRERVLAALNHQVSDRVPIDFGGYPAATSINVAAYQQFKQYLKMAIDKEIRVANTLMFTAEVDEEILQRFEIDTFSATPSIPLAQFNSPTNFFDPNWQITWLKSDVSTYAPVKGPFQGKNGTLQALKDFNWPKPTALENITLWKQKTEDLRKRTDRAIIARLPLGIVTQTQCMRGFEEWFTDFLLNRDFLETLLDRCTESWIETAQTVLDAIGDNIDVVVWGDDYGTQSGPMISPKMFREAVTPRNKRMVDAIRAKTNAKVLLHTCGSVYQYLDDFLEMGIDALNPIQTSAKDMDPIKIKSRVGDRICLWGAIGIDELRNGTPETVKELVRTRVAQLSKGGGYVLAATHNFLNDIPPQNIVAMLEAAREATD